MDNDGFYATDYSAYDQNDPNNQNSKNHGQNVLNPNAGGGGAFYNPSNPPQQNNGYNPAPVHNTNDNFGGGFGNNGPTDMYGGGFDDEPPLLEELGINFDHIIQKTKVVLNPLIGVDQSVVNETDLAGPLVIILALGSMLLLTGKMHFGYIYGISIFAVLLMWGLLKMMAPEAGPSSGCVASILGYCLLPIVGLSAISIIFSLQGTFGFICSSIAVFWCSWSASKLFCSAVNLKGEQALVAYPCAMLYGVFALLTVF